MVSSEWVAHCLEIGQILDFDAHNTFCIPDDPTRNPLVLKIKRAGGEGRYVVGDTVLYEPSAVSHRGGDASHACHQRRVNAMGGVAGVTCLLPGRIVSFCRRNRGEPAQVRMRPLFVKCLECCEIENKGRVQSCVSSKGTAVDEHSIYELAPSHMSDFLLAADKLYHHIVILSSDTRGNLDYPCSDPTVYFSSVQWEHDMGYGLTACKQDEGEDEPEMMVQHSQDY